VETQTLAGVCVPATPLVKLAMRHVQEHADAMAANHAIRSWLFAVRIGQLQQMRVDDEALALAALMHGLGLLDQFDGPYRFEIDGAHAARAFALANGMPAARAQLVWTGIALHTSHSIATHMDGEVALCAAGVALDLFGASYELMPAQELEAIVAEFPRLQLKQGFMKRFCLLAQRKPEATGDSFVREFGERFVPVYRLGPSAVDRLINSPFRD
jgi:hypothetical protein